MTNLEKWFLEAVDTQRAYQRARVVTRLAGQESLYRHELWVVARPPKRVSATLGLDGEPATVKTEGDAYLTNLLKEKGQAVVVPVAMVELVSRGPEDWRDAAEVIHIPVNAWCAAECERLRESVQ